ncbi:MAG: hypothetical protein ACRYFA_12770 [Janthinobacterium lividum]
MKTSNKLLIAVILIIIVSMVTYDFALRAEYLKGDYKSRFYRFEKITTLKAFSILDNHAANLISVQIEHGSNYSIWMENNLKGKVKISNVGNTLVIDVVDKKTPNVSPFQTSIIITCPSLDQVVMTPFFTKKEDVENGNSGETSLTGFDQQHLNLNIKQAVTLSLNKSKIEQLQALVGSDLTKNANLTIGSDNQISQATITVKGRNMLHIANSKIGKSNFNISDSAQVNLSGSFLNQFKKQ